VGVFKKGTNWYIDYYVQGRRKREKIGPSKAQARVVLQKRKVQIAEGKFLDVHRYEKIKFEDMARTYLEAYSRPNKKSSRRDSISIKHLVAFFANKYVHEMRALDVEKYKIQRLQKVSPATVNRELACLKHIYTKAKEWGKVSESPASKVKLLRERNRRLRYLEEEEIKRLYNACSEDLRPIVAVALNTGMRIGEILSLKWGDIDFRGRIIYIMDSKSGEKREVPLNRTLYVALLGVRKHRDSPFVFCGKDGKPRKDIRGAFKAALKKAEIEDFRFHDLRHTFASHLVMRGVDIKTVQELLGHKTMEMTLRYSHLSPDHKRRAVEIFDKRMDTIWTPKEKLEDSDWLDKLAKALTEAQSGDSAGVAEWVDAVDLKSTG